MQINKHTHTKPNFEKDKTTIFIVNLIRNIPNYLKNEMLGFTIIRKVQTETTMRDY